MRYDDPELIDALAREYVIGTLRGRARARFASVLASSLGARRAVARWERQLAPLAMGVAPVAPPSAVWSRIEEKIGVGKPRDTLGAGLWPALAASFALAAVVFGGLWYARPPPAEPPGYVAVFNDAQTGEPVWLLQTFVEARELRATAVDDRPEPAGNAYELWMLPDGGAAPVSLGLIAGTGETRLGLSQAQLDVLAQTATLAVSLEPAGGSPTGQPTGPVIFTAPLVRA